MVFLHPLRSFSRATSMFSKRCRHLLIRWLESSLDRTKLMISSWSDGFDMDIWTEMAAKDFSISKYCRLVARMPRFENRLSTARRAMMARRSSRGELSSTASMTR